MPTNNTIQNINGRWDAATFFERLAATNRLAVEENFTFCKVSGLEGFEEAVEQMQSTNNFICVSDVADGYTDLNNTPRTRRIKTVFFAMRHKAEDMEARTECMETMRELFRQFMTRLILEKVKLEENCIYIDPRITFNEIDRYFFSGCAGAYFQIAVDIFTDLRHNPDDWTEDFETENYQYVDFWDLYMTDYDKNNFQKSVHEVFVFVPYINETKQILLNFKDYALLISNINHWRKIELMKSIKDLQYITVKFVRHGELP